MLKKNATRLMLIGALAVTGITSCKKEDVLTPAEPNEDNKTVIYIRAVDKDSSVVESEQLLLR